MRAVDLDAVGGASVARAPSPRPSRAFVAALLLLAAAGLAVRLRAALQEPVWGDELYSRTIALLPLGEALDRAQAARSIQPWAASPYLQLALVQELGGRIDEAERSIETALANDRSDWRLWLVAARIQTKADVVQVEPFEGAGLALRYRMGGADEQSIVSECWIEQILLD